MTRATVGRVLIVEDDDDSREVLHELVAMLGHDVESVGTGEAAVASATRVEPRLVLIDIGLPDVDGHEVARRLRELGGGARLVALTGWADGVERERAREAGFDDYVVKPVRVEDLTKILAAR